MNSVNRIIIFILNLVFSLIILYVVYFYVYSKNKNNYNERVAVYERFYNISIQLDDFSNIQMKMDEQRDSIIETTSYYQDLFNSNDQNINSYKNRVSKLLEKSGIDLKDSSIVQIQKGNNIALQIKTIADYPKICSFLFEIEKFSEVSNIKMDYKNNVVMECSPILFSGQVNDNFSGRISKVKVDDVAAIGYFKEIFDKIQEVKNVGYIPTWRDFEPIPNSPFYHYVAPKKTVKKSGSYVVKSEKPEFVIDGIMYEKNNPIVIIEGKFLYTGDKYKNAKIVKINQNNIKVEYYGKTYILKMEN